MSLTRIQIQEKLLKEYSKTGFITEKQINDICDTNNIDLFDVDKIIQFLVDRKVLIQNEYLNNTDEEDGYNRAQVDYDEFYNVVLKKYPNQKYFIQDLKRTLPPQKNEWQTLIPQAKQGNVFAKKRLLAMYARSVFRHAYYFSIAYGTEFEKAFDDGIIGLSKAIDGYDITSPQSFPAYYSYYVLASMQRLYKKRYSSYDIPNHHYGELFRFLGSYKDIIQKYGINKIFEYIPDDEIKLLKKYFRDIYYYLLPTEELDLNLLGYNEKIEEFSFYKTLNEQLFKIFKSLKEKERDVIIMRFGLNDGKELTLEEVGQFFNVTRERIRQIEAKALKKMRNSRNLKLLDGFYSQKIVLNDIEESLFSPVYSSFYTDRFIIDNKYILHNDSNNEENEFSDITQ